VNNRAVPQTPPPTINTSVAVAVLDESARGEAALFNGDMA
jgi:hypothetical protein